MSLTKSKLNQPSGKAKYLIIYNSKSGKKKSFDVKKRIVLAFEQQGQSCKIVSIKNFDWNKVLLKEYKDKIKALVVAGGDGSLRMTAEIMHRLNIDMPLGFIPLGSTNWIARSLDMPLSLEKAVKKIVEGKTTLMDVGIVNNKHIFLLAACLGEIAKVSIKPQAKEKGRLGFLAYLKQVPLLFSKYQLMDLQIKTDQGKAEHIKTHSILIVNHLNIHHLKPQRSIAYNDGLLHYFALKNNTWRGLVQAGFEFYFRTIDSCMLEYKEMTELTISKHHLSSLIHLDGDRIEGIKGPIKIKVIPSYVRFIK